MKKIGIVGATGYTGEELLKNLTFHPHIQVEFITSEKEAGQPLENVFPYLPNYYHLTFMAAEESLSQNVDLVFLCLPAGESVKWGKRFFYKNVKVVDLGADFRFSNAETYKDWYHMDHLEPDLLPKAVYGLPEWNRDEIKKADIVGNPGCYPTTMLLASLPILKKGLNDFSPIIVDSKSGVSGAGKSPSKTTHYCQVNENLTAYKAGRVHRHVGEMEHQIKNFTANESMVVFTPHLTPLTRGMFSTIYIQLKTRVDKEHIFELLENVYKDEPFVHVLKNAMPGAKMPANTNHCFISAEFVGDSNTLILFSSIDNLAKGASTQAIQNMNLMLDFPETTGLL